VSRGPNGEDKYTCTDEDQKNGKKSKGEAAIGM
jgi:hypothetical protein